MNVVDSLVVELKLDATNFDRGQKRTTDDFEKTKKKLEEHSKGINEQTDKMVTGFKRLGTEILSLFGIIASADAIKRFVEQTTDANSQIKLMGENLAFPTKQLQTWAAAAREFNGSLGATISSVQTLSDKIEGMKLGQDPGQVFFRLQSQAGGKSVNTGDRVQDIKNAADDIQMMFKTDAPFANLVGRTLGIDPGTLNAWERGGSTAGGQFSGQVPTQEMIDRSQALQKAMADASTAIGNFGAVVVDRITPGLTAMADGVAHLTELLQLKGADEIPGSAVNLAGGRKKYDELVRKEKAGESTGASPDADVWNWIKSWFGSGAHAASAQSLTPADQAAQQNFPLGGVASVDGRPVSRANPMPVTIAETQGATGGFWSNLGSAIDKAFGGSGNAPAAAPDAAPSNGFWPSVKRTLGGVFGGPANAALPPGGGFAYGAPPNGAPATLTDLISQEAAKAAGGDPAKATAIRQRMEGIRNGESIKASDSRYDVNLSGGDRSYGPFQMNRIAPGALGSVFEQETAAERKRLGLGGLEDPRTIPLQTRWVAKYLARGKSVEENLGPWGGPNWSTHSPREADPNWKNTGYDPGMMSLYQPTPSPEAGVTPFFGRNPHGQFSGWAMDWGQTSAAARAAMVGSGAVTNTTSSSEVNIGHIDLHSHATEAFGLAQDFAKSLREQSDAMGANYGAM